MQYQFIIVILVWGGLLLVLARIEAGAIRDSD